MIHMLDFKSLKTHWVYGVSQRWVTLTGYERTNTNWIICKTKDSNILAVQNSEREGVVLDAELPEQMEGFFSRIKTLKQQTRRSKQFRTTTKNSLSNILPKVVRGLKGAF